MHEPPHIPPPGETAADAPDADAAIRLGASTDRMKLIVSSYVPARGSGRPLDADLVLRTARQSGITQPLNRDAVDRVVEMLLAGQDVREVIIAQGVKPVPLRDAQVEPLAEFVRPVFPGMAFGRLVPARRPEPGRDLKGNVIPVVGRSEPAELAAPPDGNCVHGPDGELKATAYGLVEVGDGAIRVRPLVVVSADRLAVTGTIYGYDAAGATITASRVEAELERLGVGQWADVGRIIAALEEAWETRQSVPDVLLAQGKPPVHGADARLELLVAERRAVGYLDSQGRMDWRDRGFTPVVEEGQDIARLHPATAGTAGTDVYGQSIPARSGKPLAVKPGPNVEVLEEGRLFRARSAGVVLTSRGVIDVSDLLVIPGDVDLATGNIRTQRGSVQIRGTIRAGGAVEAPDSVLVGGAIEDALVVAGADVTVTGGIVMDPEGATEIRAGGSVTAAFAQNARITAGEDVTVNRYIARSDVQAGFNIRAEGYVRVTSARGRIMGGTVVSGQGIEVYEAGSPLGVATVLVLTQENEEARALIAEKRRLRAEAGSIAETLRQLVPEKVAQLPVEKRAQVKAMLARREEIAQLLEPLGRKLALLAQEALARMESGRIVVRGMAHPGVVVKMGGTSLHLTSTLQSSQFFWSREERAIKAGKL